VAKNNAANPSRKSETLPFKIHPRVFKALGADLVTNDVVAIIELVKNAYDAYATVVDVRFKQDGAEWVLEIEDNGSGMSRATIEDAWCTVATPYRKEHSVAKHKGRHDRQTSGEKGLGRLSSARLGTKLEMVTQTAGGECWTLQVDWESLSNSGSLEQCVATIQRTAEPPFETSGTRLRIWPLQTVWNDQAWDDLRDNLARLLPPFDVPYEFAIRLSTPGLFDDAINVKPPGFLKHPKYLVRGTVDDSGKVKYEYKFAAMQGDGHRSSKGTVTWAQVKEQTDDATLKEMETPSFGPFTFDIRAWDNASDDLHEIAERFELKKAKVKEDIKAYKGISVYRDGVLVLPKSEGTRDWLGLDVRRIGKVGKRMSTTQMVGYVAITATENPEIEDTSDRERLAATPEVLAFEETLRVIVSVMENERQKDRHEAPKEPRVSDLFKQLDAKGLVSGVAEVASAGGSASDALPLVEEFSDNLEKAREEIETRFVYYSRLATVGTIALMLIHEVRQRTTILGSVFDWLSKRIGLAGDDKDTAGKVEKGRTAVAALDKLANTFAPLANRQFKRRVRSAIIEESAKRCVEMLEGEWSAAKIALTVPTGSTTEVAVDPGELDAVLLNLLSNAVYWLAHKGGAERKIEVRIRKAAHGKRAFVEVHDTGPGVAEDMADKVFWPGVTQKPGGIGMGLTVASEIVAEYDGKLALDRKGKLGGATFLFDLPLK
jgi:signal transduction histidine kinase